jgi:hypothetical protein
MAITERDPDPGRRERARYDALCRARPGDDIDALTDQIVTELENDPFDFVFAQTTAAAPPPDEWDPDLARELRRLFRGALAPLLLVRVRLRWAAWVCQWGRGCRC